VTTAAKRELVSTRLEREMVALRALSARVGSDPLLVQASNGNTSIKSDGTLWIKASGRWLANATREELFMGVDLEAAKQSLQTGSEILPLDDATSDLRPSIETPMHAAIPHRVVIHVHSINAISWAIRLDGPEQIKERLAGLRWQWIPYAASGNPLAREIAKAAARTPETNVFILGSHGLVVCGKDCDSAEKLLREVDWRLAIPPRKFAKPNVQALNFIARFPGWRFPEVESLHAMATDATCRRTLQGGVLYPCQAIFLGQAMPFLPARIAESKFAQWLDAQESVPPFVAVEGIGVMVNERMTSAERATLRALAEVTLRTAESAPLRYLNAAEVADVLSQGAHGGKDVSVMKEKANSLPHPVSHPRTHSVHQPVSHSGSQPVSHSVTEWVTHSVRHSVTNSVSYSLTTITRFDMGRKSLHNLNACAAWLGSHSKKLRSRLASARIGLGA
jgi:rhamnose utilization protein RhaD (predicted bifunctional aldolase and dehydrogenase)